MTKKLNILLLGATGRLGHRIAQKLVENNISFVALNRSHTSSFETFDHFIQSIQIDDNTQTLLLDVSTPNVTHEIGNFLLTMQTRQPRFQQDNKNKNFYHKIDGVLIGTTGHSDDCRLMLKELSSYIPICIAPNFSKGVFLLGRFLETSLQNGENFSSFAKKLGFEVSLCDVHHQHKKDSPSGTALWLNQWVGVPPESIQSIRTGEVIGEHSILFKTHNETIDIVHKVTSRDVFADGACDLSKQFFEKCLSPGIYSPSTIWMS